MHLREIQMPRDDHEQAGQQCEKMHRRFFFAPNHERSAESGDKPQDHALKFHPRQQREAHGINAKRMLVVASARAQQISNCGKVKDAQRKIRVTDNCTSTLSRDLWNEKQQARGN